MHARSKYFGCNTNATTILFTNYACRRGLAGRLNQKAAFARICRNIRTDETLQQSRGGLASALRLRHRSQEQ